MCLGFIGKISALVCLFKLALIIFSLGLPSDLSAQIGLKTPVINLRSGYDSLAVSFPMPVLPLRDWQESTNQYFYLKAEVDKIDISHYISPENIIPSDPFKTDRRGSSYYVPRMVRDELNLIMNRPKDHAFVPILPVAFLAVQLASQYLIIQQKTEITYKDIAEAEEAYPILEELWEKNPQTLSELYKKGTLQDNYTMIELQRLMDLLVVNKLVKRKLIENSETQYFYSLDKIRYDFLVEKEKSENIRESNQSQSPSVEINPK
jgi:hypothetical protein